MHNDYLYSMMKVSSQLPGMTPSETKKPPKLGFSIDSLVGGQRPASRDPDDNQGPPSPLSLASVFPGSLLSKPDKVPIIQRPQPINGAIHRPSSDAALLLSNALNIPKGIGAPLSHHLVPPSLGFNPLANIPGIPLHTQLNPLLMGAGVPPLGPPIQRDYPLYPWLLSRHNRVFPQGLPSPEHLAYLLHPFRKPKRIRTAFSPNQLLKLEQAFEKNQYVVGTERKQLAHTLNLSETQVKVWFQNRRTKEKRSNTDGETPPGCKIGIDEDEEIDDDDIEEEVEERRKKELERLKDMSYDMPTTSVDKKYPESTSTYSFPDLPTTSTPLSASLSTSVSLSSLRNESSSPVPVNTTAPCDFPRSDSIKMESTCVSTS